MAGRPRAFKTVVQLQKGIDAYLVTDEPLSMAGLAASLGVNKDTVYVYQRGEYGDEYSDPIKKVVDLIEAQTVTGLLASKLNTAGAIFILKNNFGYRDQRYIEETNIQKEPEPKSLEESTNNVITRLQAAR